MEEIRRLLEIGEERIPPALGLAREQRKHGTQGSDAPVLSGHARHNAYAQIAWLVNLLDLTGREQDRPELVGAVAEFATAARAESDDPEALYADLVERVNAVLDAEE